MKIALAQMNPIVGNFEKNYQKINSWIQKAKHQKVDLIIFPEMALLGYPPEDLLLKPGFIRENRNWMHALIQDVGDISVVVGFVDQIEGRLYNAAGFIHDHQLKEIYHKQRLPNYGVFDEKRYFSSGQKNQYIQIKEKTFLLTICEDVWDIEYLENQYIQDGSPHIDGILNLSASPYQIHKINDRYHMLQQVAIKFQAPIFYVNIVGGQDEIIFDGQSMVVNAKGEIVFKAKSFDEDLTVIQLETIDQREIFSLASNKKPLEEIYQALVCGLKNYVIKNGFKEVILGLSGGVDSALVAVLAKDALGSDSVHTLFMPSRFSSNESFEDAQQLSEMLKVHFDVIEIEPMFQPYLKSLDPFFKDTPMNTTEENLQARIRGDIVMAFSNKFGYLVLVTGNKSEMSVGYCTLYGDMAGGLAVIKDVNKTLVYELCRYRNTLADHPIPERILTKEPTAELRDNQKDTDSLPPYDLLDPILKAYVEEGATLDDLLQMDYDPDVVRKIVRLVDLNEYKRRQGPPGLKITPRAFGKDWRFPITNHFSKY